MKDVKFWIQVFVNVALPLVLGSGLLGVLSLFRERLPDWSFNLIIAITSVVFVIVFCVLIVMLLRLTFGDWFNKLWRWRQKRAVRENKMRLLNNWREKLVELSSLILKVADADWQATEEQQDRYTSLRAWFQTSRSKLLPSWGHFFYGRTKSAKVGRSTSTSTLEHVVFYDNALDPFSVFYEPMTFSLMRDSFFVYRDKAEIQYVLLKLYDRMDEFYAFTLARYD